MKQVPAKRRIYFADTPSIIAVTMPMFFIYKEKIKWTNILHAKPTFPYSLPPRMLLRTREIAILSAPVALLILAQNIHAARQLIRQSITSYIYENLIIISTLDYFLEQVYVSVFTHRIYPNTKKSYKNIRYRMTLQKWSL